MTLQQIFDYLTVHYSVVNAMYMQDRDVLNKFLLSAVRNLGKIIRKSEKNLAIRTSAVAHIFTRANALAATYCSLPIVDALSAKYPKGRCAYCSYGPCACGRGIRFPVKLAEIDPEQQSWTIAEFMANNKFVYRRINETGGPHHVYQRLTEEIGEEVDAQLIDVHDRRMTLPDLRLVHAREFADIFAWTFAMANTLEIDLDRRLTEFCERGKCTRCGQHPCLACGPFYIRQLEQSQSFTADTPK